MFLSSRRFTMILIDFDYLRGSLQTLLSYHLENLIFLLQFDEIIWCFLSLSDSTSVHEVVYHLQGLCTGWLSTIRAFLRIDSFIER